MTRTLRSSLWRPAGLAAIFLLSALPGDGQATGQVPGQAPGPPRTDFPPPTVQKTPRDGRIRANVDLVSLTVSVQDSSGRPVADLPREAFTVLDEGVPQQISVFEAQTQQPLDMALMIDTSLSATKELEFEGAAAMRFIKAVVRPQDTMAVYTFSEHVDRLTPYTSNPTILEAGLKRMLAGGGTSLYDAIYLASDELSRRPPGRRRVIVLVTDAGETTSRASFDDARRGALAAEALLYTIIVRALHSEALRDLAGEHAVRTITDSTGGAMFIANDLNEVERHYGEIDQELRTQYLLAFYPQPPPPRKSVRHLQVRVAAGAAADGALRVRSRQLYLTDGGPP
jgi:Ca-activated chloride channel homolog